MIGKEILNYVILSEIGSGGMGTVYLAENKYISKQKVAIKMLHADIVNDFTRKRLKEEAEHLAELDHPNIVKFINYHIEDGNIFLIMEYAEGVTLEHYINNVNGLIVEDKICAIFEPILDAMRYAHSKGIVHRDIKPANIIITPEGTPKILDFGIATIIGKKDDNYVAGTPSFMSPEQVKGDELDQRSDIYSLGVMLHEMMTGKAPYDTTTLTAREITEKVVNEPLPPMKAFYKYINPRTQAVVDKATSKDADARFQNCADFRRELHRAIYPPKMPRWVWAAASLLILLIAGGAFWYWDYNCTKVTYFRDYTEQWGVPVGIGELSESEHSHAHRAYRFESSQGKVRRVSHVNNIDKIIIDGESERVGRPVDAVFQYTPDGKLARVKVMDHNGKVLYVKAYNENLKTATFQYDDEYGTEKTLGANILGYNDAMSVNPDTNKGKISRFHYTYDENGFVTKLEYAGLYNADVCDADNVYGIEYKRDGKGRVIEETYLNNAGNPTATNWGLGHKNFTYDDSDNLIKVVYTAPDGNPALDAEGGTAMYEMIYDRYGNVVEARHLAADGNPMIPKRLGFAIILSEYDSNGYTTRVSVYNQDREPINCKEGYHSYTAICDENGFFCEQRFFDAEGNPTRDKKNAAIYMFKNDAKGNQLETSVFDENGEPTVTNGVVHKTVWRVDSLGNFISYFYYGLDGKLVANPNDANTVGCINEYDQFGRIIKFVNFNTDSIPAKCEMGYVARTFTYDQTGNKTEDKIYEDAGCMVLTENIYGIAIIRSKYDDNGNLVESAVYGKDGELTVNEENIALCTYSYDERGNCIQERYFDVKGNLTLCSKRYAGINYKYDERNNVIEEYNVGLDGNLAQGFLIARNVYDEDNNKIECSYFNSKGQPALNYDNIHRETFAYTPLRQQSKQHFFGVDGKPTVNMKNGIASAEAEYDDFGNIIEMRFYGIDGKPTESKEHYYMQRSEYDAMGRVIRQTYFDTESKPTDSKKMVPEGLTGYDSKGRLIFIASADGKGNYIDNVNMGASIKRLEYDAKDRIIKDAFFDKKDKPTISTVDGCHFATYVYDDAGNQTEIAYFGTDGKPMLNAKQGGVHKIVKTYDRLSRQSSEAYYNTSGRLMNAYGFIAKFEYFYNDDSNTIARAKNYDASGKLLLDQRWDGSQWIPVGGEYYSGTSEEDDSDELTPENLEAQLNEFRKELPMDLGDECDNMSLIRIDYTKPADVRFVFQTPMSVYEMTDEQKNKYIGYARDLNAGMQSSLPSFLNGSLVLLDKRDREIYSGK